MGAGLIAAETVAELVARQMKFVVSARRTERAALLARRPEQVLPPFEELATMLDRVEVVVCATGARTPLLRFADIRDAMARRNGKPLVIVDLSLGRAELPLRTARPRSQPAP